MHSYIKIQIAIKLYKSRREKFMVILKMHLQKASQVTHNHNTKTVPVVKTFPGAQLEALFERNFPVQSHLLKWEKRH